MMERGLRFIDVDENRLELWLEPDRAQLVVVDSRPELEGSELRRFASVLFAEYVARDLGDRLGARSLLTIMALGWSVLTAAIPLVVFQQSRPVLGLALTPFWFLLTVRFLFGVFQAGIFPAISRMMADWMPIEERGTSQGLVWTFSRLGGAVAPFVIGGVTALLHSWQWCLVVVSGLGLVWCAITGWGADAPGRARSASAGASCPLTA